MKTFLKFLLTVFIWAVIFAVCVGAAILLEAEVELAIKVFIGLFATWYGIKLIIYLLKRWRAKQQVSRLVNVDEANKTSTSDLFWKNLSNLSEFDKHIKEVLRYLKNSGLNRHSDALNAVPWVIHLGHNNTAKNWLAQSNSDKPQLQSALFTEHPFVDWYPLNDQLVLDVSTKLLPQSGTVAPDALEFFDSLVKLNRNNVIDSLVMSIDLDTLTDGQALTATLKSYRRFFELLRLNCNVDAPVNLVIHGLESTPGMQTWLTSLQPHQTEQILGYRNINNLTANEFLDTCFERLAELTRQSTLSSIGETSFDKNIAALPRFIEERASQVNPKITNLFNSNRFQSAPVFAGCYFVMQSNANVLFTEDLLAKPYFVWKPSIVTRRQMKYFSPQKLVWYGVTVALAITFYTIANSDQAELERVYAEYAQKIKQEPRIDNEVINLIALTELIEELSQISVSHWLPASDDPLKQELLTKRLLKRLQDDVLQPIDESFSTRLATSLNTEDMASMDTTVDYINIMIRRINFLQAALNGASKNDLKALPLPYDSAYLSSFPDDMLAQLNDLYIYSIFKRLNAGEGASIKASLHKQRAQLKDLLVSSGGNFDWLVDWVNRNRSAKDISLKKYWKNATGQFAATKIKRAYTVEGKKIIDDFLTELTDALQDKELVDSWLPRFNSIYEQNYFDAWASFMVGFEEGIKALNSRDEWLSTINNLTTARSHYFALLNDADFHLSPLEDSEFIPEWFDFLVYYQDMLALGQDDVQDNTKRNKVLTKLALKFIGVAGPVGKAVAGAGKSSLKTKKKLDKTKGSGPGPSERELLLNDAAAELDNYKRAIADLVYNIERRKFAYSNVAAWFENPDNPAGAGTALGNALASIRKLQGLIGKSSSTNQAFWSIYVGPIVLMQEYMLSETACLVEDKWQKEFLADLDGVPEYKLPEFVYGDAGVLWAFVDNQVAPFVERRAGAGYRLARVDEQKITLVPDFLMFLTQSRDQKVVQKFNQFKLAVEALPTNVDKEALLYVSKTQVQVECGENIQTITNRNFPVEYVLNWDQTCGPTKIEFTIANRTLTKHYPGSQGLLNFLKDFEDGSHEYGIEEFPDHFYAMNEFKISTINANLAINGAGRLIQMLSHKPVHVPQKIAQCWGE